MHEDESSEKNEGVENGSSEESENGMEFDEAFERDIPDETVLETVHPPADDSGISMDNKNLTEKEQTDKLLERLTLREATITQLQLAIILQGLLVLSYYSLSMKLLNLTLPIPTIVR